ncbi:MAG: hypothetical protein KJT01_01120 [Gemmatimonadetes bacterium]|nr:hypothetical protein [Gemmatimonadota bacterium]
MINAPATATDHAAVSTALLAYPDADAIAARLTRYPDLLSLVIDAGGIPTYRPSLSEEGDAGILADAYDMAQILRRDGRRASRM